MQIDWRPYIHTNPKILMGKPTIKGTRIAAEQILELLGQGYTSQRMIEEFPSLTEEQILVTLSYAADCIRKDALFEYIP